MTTNATETNPKPFAEALADAVDACVPFLLRHYWHVDGLQHADAEDIAQEAAAILIERHREGRFTVDDATASVRTYLFGVAKRLLANHARAMRRAERATADLRVDVEGPTPVAVDDRAERIMDALDSISGVMREAIELHYVHGADVRTVARETRSSVAATHKRLQRGRAMLARLVGAVR